MRGQDIIKTQEKQQPEQKDNRIWTVRSSLGEKEEDNEIDASLE